MDSKELYSALLSGGAASPEPWPVTRDPCCQAPCPVSNCRRILIAVSERKQVVFGQVGGGTPGHKCPKPILLT